MPLPATWPGYERGNALVEMRCRRYPWCWYVGTPPAVLVVWGKLRVSRGTQLEHAVVSWLRAGYVALGQR